MSETYLNYYDIFVRHAFGNYRDVLREVSYSPMMAEMLSYLDSKSSAYVMRTTGSKSFPDENFAREVSFDKLDIFYTFAILMMLKKD